MNADALIKAIGEEFGVSLGLNENLVASLIIDEKFDVEFEYVEDIDTLYVSSPLARLTGSNKESIYKALLDANLYGKDTGGSVFALDDRTDEIILFFNVEAAKIEYEKFRDMLERYLNVRTQWITNFERIVEEHREKRNDGEGQGFDLNFAIRI